MTNAHLKNLLAILRGGPIMARISKLNSALGHGLHTPNRREYNSNREDLTVSLAYLLAFLQHICNPERKLKNNVRISTS